MRVIHTGYNSVPGCINLFYCGITLVPGNDKEVNINSVSLSILVPPFAVVKMIKGEPDHGNFLSNVLEGNKVMLAWMDTNPWIIPQEGTTFATLFIEGPLQLKFDAPASEVTGESPYVTTFIS